MAVFSPQMRATQSGAGLRKKKTPYVDLIRGQYGQATQDVLAKRQESDLAEQRQQNLNIANKGQKLAKDQFKLQKKTAKEQAKQAKIGMGLSAGKLGLNVLNQFGGSAMGQSAGGGLIGAGAAQLIPGSKVLKGLGGGVMGGLASYLSGGNKFGSMGGSILGSLGSLF